MSAWTPAVGAERRDGAKRSIPWEPREGWGSLVLLSIMLATLGVAIDDANWAGFAVDGGLQTSWLPTAAVLSVLVGSGLAKTRLPLPLVHLIAAAAGAAYLLVAIANVLSDAPALVDRLRDLNRSFEIFYEDLVILGIRSSETSAFLLTIGTVVWAVGQFAAVNVYRRGRVMPAIVAAGLVLLVNVSVTVRLQYLHLIVFSAAAMLLLVRMNLQVQREGWSRRRIGDTAQASGLFLRGGVGFVLLTVVGAATLAATASSAPLANTWRNLDDTLLNVGSEVNRVIGGVTGAARGPSGLFSSSQTISNIWESSSEVVFHAASSDDEGYYWRGATYDRFDGYIWQQTETQEAAVPAGGELLAGSAERASVPGLREVQLTVTSETLAGGTMLAPAIPLAVDRPADVVTHEAGGPMVAIDFRDAVAPGEAYTVQVAVPETDPELGAVTGADLAAAGVDYPGWALRYVDIQPESIGDIVYTTMDGILDSMEGPQDPYHVALAVEHYLYQGGDFIYQTNLVGLCGRESAVDCFLRTKRGFCQQFATAMVMLLRTEEIPARIALGYLPGRQREDGTWDIPRSAAHAWVEVYFPEYGWVKFDPTPGNIENGQEPSELDPGEPSPSDRPGSTARPSFSLDPGIDEGAIIPGGGREGPPPGGGAPAEGPAGSVGITLVVGLLAALAVAVVLLRRRRLPYLEPDLAYRGVARLAGRFGYGPQPTQTAYEYAGTLADVMPRVRRELDVVARAKVETTYARRSPDTATLVQLRDAVRRIRIGLVRLLFRRRPGSGRSLGRVRRA